MNTLDIYKYYSKDDTLSVYVKSFMDKFFKVSVKKLIISTFKMVSTIIMINVKNTSYLFFGVMSPYPTVVIKDIVRYKILI